MTRAVQISRTGGADVLNFVEVPMPQPQAGQVRVRIQAIGLNRAEVLFRSGRYIEPTRLPARIGYEAAGLIDAVGPAVEAFKPGDAVSVIPAFSMNDFGVYAEQAVVPVSAVLERPARLDAIQSAAVWMAFLTSYGALVDIGGLARGDAVVIQAASSSVGLAAIQIANRIGAMPIATTRDAGKRERLLAAGATHVFLAGEGNVAEEVMRVTGGRGARIVFDPVGGAGTEALAQAMTAGGVFFLYGNLSGMPAIFPRRMIKMGQSMRGYLVFEIAGNAARLARAQAYIVEGLQCGQFSPAIDSTFPFERIADAHRYIESNRQFGKVVVTVP